MKILVITSSFPRHDRDLAGLFVKEWAEALAALDNELHILCWRGPGAEDYQPAPGVDVHFVSYGPPSAEQLFFGAGAPENLSSQPLSALMAIPAFAAMVGAALRALRDDEFDAVAGHWLVPGGLIARLVGYLTDTPSYVVGHSGGVHLLSRLPRSVARPLARFLCAGPTTIPTTPLAEKLAKLTDGTTAEVEIAPMGFSPPPPALPRTEATHLRLGFLGRLVPIKNLPVLFEALELLAHKTPNLTLEIVGHGPCRPEWERLAPSNVTFSGPLYGLKKWRFLHRCDALVLPSRPRPDGRHEGLPVSVLEASAAGAIPLVSGVPGIDPWLADPTHQIVDGGPDAWRNALLWLSNLAPDQLTDLRRKNQTQISQLAWPNYAPWWHSWLRTH